MRASSNLLLDKTYRIVALKMSVLVSTLDAGSPKSKVCVRVIPRNSEVVEGLTILLFAKGMPSKLQTCKRNLKRLLLFKLRLSDKKSFNN